MRSHLFFLRCLKYKGIIKDLKRTTSSTSKEQNAFSVVDSLIPFISMPRRGRCCDNARKAYWCPVRVATTVELQFNKHCVMLLRYVLRYVIDFVWNALGGAQGPSGGLGGHSFQVPLCDIFSFFFKKRWPHVRSFAMWHVFFLTRTSPYFVVVVVVVLFCFVFSTILLLRFHSKFALFPRTTWS